MTSFDLTSAFLQILLQARSRKHTAFLFDTNIYQFQRVPFGKKNTLATFVGGLRKVFESDVSSFCSCYVDEIVIFSKTFVEHLGNINLIFNQLTTAGFYNKSLEMKILPTTDEFSWASNRTRCYINRSTEDCSDSELSGPEKSKTDATTQELGDFFINL